MKYQIRAEGRNRKVYEFEIEASDMEDAKEIALATLETEFPEEKVYRYSIIPKEDKQLICTKLLEALQCTRELSSLEDLMYLPEKEKVEALFSSGYRKYANVECDSGIAMIVDIIKQIT